MAKRMDELMPAWDQREVHEASIAAPPAEVDAALRGLAIADMPVVRMMFALRALPGRLGRGGLRLPSPARPFLDAAREMGFVVLADEPGREMVLGAVGRFWRVRGADFAPISGAEDFVAFTDPGWARSAMDFVLEPAAGGTRVVTETRVQATDESARRAMRRYWRVIGPGSALIRRLMLAAVRRRAEKG